MARYRTPLSGDLIVNPFAALSEPRYAISAPQAAELTRVPQELVFDFTASPIPTNSADIFLMVVWQGKLGSEDGAVLVGGKNLFEPDPYDPGNATDYDCYQDQIRSVTSPSIATVDRDLNDDGAQDLFGPAVESNRYIQIYDPFRTPPSDAAVRSSHHFFLNQTRYAQGGRFMMLQDQPFFGVAILIDRTEDEFTRGVSFSDRFDFTFPAVQNEIGPGGIRIVTPSFSYRGVPLFHGDLRLASPKMLASVPCQSQLRFAPPNMTRIEGTVQDQ